MKYLITGATGLVGNVIKQLLISQGHQVNYLTSSPEKIISTTNERGFLWNVKEMTIDLKCLEGVDTLIHLAGESVFQKWTDDVRIQIMESRTNSTKLLFNAINDNDNQLKHVISASAIGVYPDAVGNAFYKENDIPPTANNFLADVVVAWEKAADEFKSLGIIVSKVRIGIVLSSEGGALPQMAAPVRMYVGSGFGNGKQWQSWIALDDLARIFYHISIHKLEGVFNAVSPEPIENRKMIKAIGKTLNRPVWLPNIPSFLLKLFLGEMSSILLGSQLVSSFKIEQAGYDFKYPKLNQALEHYLKSS